MSKFHKREENMKSRFLGTLLAVVLAVTTVMSVSIMPAEAASLKTTVSGLKVPMNTLTYKSSYSVRGTVTSTKKITKVQIAVKNIAKNKWEIVKSERKNSKKISLATLSRQVTFGKLTTGQKLLRIKVWSGKTSKTVYVGLFNVKKKTAAKPVASIASGDYYAAQKLTLKTATSGATIYYTTDGKTPTASSAKYTKALTVSKTTTLKAIAVKSGIAKSPVTTVNINMVDAYPTAVSFASEIVSAYTGQEVALAPVFEPVYTNKRGLTWTSDNPGVATVDTNGVISTWMAGTANITCTTENGITKTLALTVALNPDVTHTHIKQAVSGECVLTCYAMLLTNLGIPTTPAALKAANGGRDVTPTTLATKYGVNTVCALSASSPYLTGFKNGRTYVKSGAENVEAAIKEAILRNPEGVLVYAVNSRGSHGVVAVELNAEGQILYDDPGRDQSKGQHVVWSETWGGYAYGQTLANVQYIVAHDRADGLSAREAQAKNAAPSA